MALLPQQLITILDALEDVRGKKKAAMLKQFCKIDQFIKLITILLDGAVTFNIKKLPKKPKIQAETVYTDIFSLIYFLRGKASLKARDLAVVYETLARITDPREHYWVKKIILKQSLAGLGAKSVNKALGYELIPTFNIILCAGCVTDFSKVQYPVYVQPKLDGFRCTYIPGEGFIGRNGKKIVNAGLPEYIDIQDNALYVLDGELYSHTHTFNAITSILNTKDKTIPPEIHYTVFDCIPIEEWKAQKGKTIYRDRLNVLDGYSWSAKIDRIDTVTARSPEELKAKYEAALAEGYEGAIIRGINQPYPFRRVTAYSGIIGRIKPSEKEDLKIVDWYQGKDGTKLEGKWAGWVCKRENGVAVDVGGGYNDAEREQFNTDPDQYKGMWIRVGYTEETPDGSLRFPRYKHHIEFRDAKD